MREKEQHEREVVSTLGAHDHGLCCTSTHLDMQLHFRREEGGRKKAGSRLHRYPVGSNEVGGILQEKMNIKKRGKNGFKHILEILKCNCKLVFACLISNMNNG